MKLSFLFLCTVLLQISATGFNQEVKLSMQLKDVSVKTVFKEIESKTNYRFVFNDEVIADLTTVSVRARNQEIGEILDDLLSNSGIEYRVLEDKLIVLAPKNHLFKQGFVVQGKVTDAEGAPLPGVNIVEKGTANGAVTDLDGNYSISVSDPNATLVYSFVGYLAEEVPVNERTSIDLTLVEDVTALDEVVVVGYGTQSKRSLSTAVSSVGGEELESIQVESVDNALQGKIAGLNVRQTSGQPGSGIHVTIRGIGSERGSDPLWVIDGVQVQGGFDAIQNPLQFLDPKDIKSIQVLKDAAAAAIYGAQASGGVILVETKTGARNKRATINFRASFGVQEYMSLPEVLSPEDYANAMIEARDNVYVHWHGYDFNDDDATRRGNVGSSSQIGIFKAWQNGESIYEPEDRNYPFYLNPEGTIYTDEILNGSPYIQDYQISANGGSENSAFYISGSYRNNQGLLTGYNGFERFSVRANYNADITDKIRVGFNVNPNYITQGGMFTGGRIHVVGIWPSVLASSPIMALRNPDGTFQSNINGHYSGIQNNENPVMKAEMIQREFEKTQVLGRLYLDFDILSGLTFRSAVSGNYRRNQYLELWPSAVGRWGSRGGRVTNDQEHTLASDFRYQITEQIDYNNTFLDDHTIGVTAAFEAIKDVGKDIELQAEGLPDAFLSTVNELPGDNVDEVSYLENAFTMASFIGRINYSFKDKYFISATMRRDGSSRFGPDDRWGNFPSVSGAWIVSDESFFTIPTMSLLKLKASWGKVGNHNIGNYRWMTTMNQLAYVYGASEEYVLGYGPLGSGNPALRWEAKESLNVGFESAFFDRRLSFNLDYYKDTNKDFLQQVGVPTIAGFGSIWTNFGEMAAQGVDMSLNARIFTGEFKWNTTANFATQSSRIIDLEQDEALDRDFNGNFLNEVDAPYGNLWFQVYDGVYESEEDIATSPIKENTSRIIPGVAKIEDINKDGVLDDKDKRVVGNSFPKYLFGFTNEFSFKNIHLSVHTEGKIGATIWDRAYSELTGANTNILKDYYDNRSRIEPNGNVIPGEFPIITRGRGGPPGFGATTMEVFSSDYLAIRNITLAYDLPTSLINRINAQGLRLSFSVQNVGMITNYPFSNPDGYSQHGGDTNIELNQYGVNEGSYPLTRVYTFGLNLTL